VTITVEKSVSCAFGLVEAGFDDVVRVSYVAVGVSYVLVGG
jgi:hypothetical protein